MVAAILAAAFLVAAPVHAEARTPSFLARATHRVYCSIAGLWKSPSCVERQVVAPSRPASREQAAAALYGLPSDESEGTVDPAGTGDATGKEAGDQAPTIELIGSDPAETALGAEYSDLGVVAKDGEGVGDEGRALGLDAAGDDGAAMAAAEAAVGVVERTDARGLTVSRHGRSPVRLANTEPLGAGRRPGEPQEARDEPKARRGKERAASALSA